MLKLNIRPTAAVDLAETLAWYGGVSSTLADAFLEQLDITAHPRKNTHKRSH
jgi:hypothetical protein